MTKQRNLKPLGHSLWGALLALCLFFGSQNAFAHPDHGQKPAPQAPVVTPHDHHHPQPKATAPAKPDCCDKKPVAEAKP